MRRLAFVLGLLAATVLAAGCSAEKAKALSSLAIQFKVEAVAALDLIDQMRARELEAPPRPRVEAAREFATAVLAQEGPLVPSTLNVVADPFTVPAAESDWNLRSAELRTQYALFADMFADLVKGSYFAKDPVAASKKIAADLTLQLLAFADSIDKNPPVFIQRRAALIVDIERVRMNKEMTQAQKLDAIAPYLERWETLLRDERRLGDEVIAQCLKAAMLGRQVRKLADEYERLSLDDISSIVVDALDTAGAITGRDATDVKNKVAETIANVKADPIWKDRADEVLANIARAAAQRDVPQLSAGGEL